MDMTPETNESAIDLLAGLIDKSMSDEAADSILHAIYYLRTGKYPFNRKKIDA